MSLFGELRRPVRKIFSESARLASIEARMKSKLMPAAGVEAPGEDRAKGHWFEEKRNETDIGPVHTTYANQKDGRKVHVMEFGPGDYNAWESSPEAAAGRSQFRTKSNIGEPGKAAQVLAEKYGIHHKFIEEMK